MSGLDSVRVGFALARAAYGLRGRLVQHLAEENERLRWELAETRARAWRLQDAIDHWYRQPASSGDEGRPR